MGVHIRYNMAFYLLILSFVAIYIFHPKRSDLPYLYIVAFILILTVFISTSLYSPSLIYVKSKLFFTYTIPPAMFFSGMIASRQNTSKTLLYAASGISLVSSVLFQVNNSAGYKEVFGDSADALTYQNISYLYAGTAAIVFSHLMSATDRLKKTIMSVLVVYLLLLIVNSGGRGGLLFAAVSITAAMIVAEGRPINKLVVGLGVVLIVGGVVFYDFFMSLIAKALASGELPFTFERIAKKILGIGSSFSEYGVITRRFLRFQAFHVWLENPLLGVGWGGFPIVAGIRDESGHYPHNIILELLAETGLFGFFIFFGFVAYVLFKFMKSSVPSSKKRLALAIFAGGAGMSMVSADFPQQRYLNFALGMMVGLIAENRNFLKMKNAAFGRFIG